MKELFWKTLALLFILSIFWLGWCIKEASNDVNIRPVEIDGTVSVAINRPMEIGGPMEIDGPMGLFNSPVRVKIIR